MLSSDIESPEDPCALIEGARFGDADFYGKWLLAAADAEALWKMIQRDKQFTTLLGGDIPDLGVRALRRIVASLACDVPTTWWSGQSWWNL